MLHTHLLTLAQDSHIDTPEALLAPAATALLTALPDAQAVAVLRLGHHGVQTWYRTDETDTAPYILYRDQPRYQEAIASQTIVADHEHGAWIVPLIYHAEVFVLLVVEMSALGADVPDQLVSFAEQLAPLLYMKKLEVLVQRQADASQQISEATHLQAIARILSQSMLQQHQFVTVSRFNYDASQQLTGLTVVASANRQSVYENELQVDIDLPILQNLHDTLRRDGTLYIDDLSDDEAAHDSPLSPEAHTWFRNSQMRSIYFLPFSLRDDRLAYIAVNTKKSHMVLSAMDQRFYQGLVKQVETVINKQQLLEQSQRSAQVSAQQVQIQQVVTHYGQELSMHLHLHDIVATTLAHVPQLIDVDAIYIFSYSVMKQDLHQIGHYWQEQAQITEEGATANTGDVPLLKQVIKERQFIYHASFNAPSLEPSLQSGMAMPLQSGGVLLGAWMVGSQQADHFSIADQTIFRQLGNLLATALSNVNAYAQNRLVMQNKMRINDIITQLQRQTSVQNILSVAAQELGVSLRAKRVRIRLGYPIDSQDGDILS